VSAFVLNRSHEEVQLEVELRGLGERTVAFAQELHHADIKAINTKDKPNEVSPRDKRDLAIRGEMLTTTLQPLSWTVVNLV
jgi:alpha-N-arabinofuranosidase